MLSADSIKKTRRTMTQLRLAALIDTLVLTVLIAIGAGLLALTDRLTGMGAETGGAFGVYLT